MEEPGILDDERLLARKKDRLSISAVWQGLGGCKFGAKRQDVVSGGWAAVSLGAFIESLCVFVTACYGQGL